MNIDFLRKKYPVFEYTKYNWQAIEGDLKISFDFLIKPDIYFKPELLIKGVSIKNKETIDNLVFNLGMVELLSYWKAVCSPLIVVKAGSLDKKQIRFFEDLLFKGMGQFFYENKIDFTKKDFVKITADSPKLLKRDNIKLRDRNLIAFGGGKDSFLTRQILKGSTFSLNPQQPVDYTVERQIDPKLLELNQKGFLNGHTPFSAYLAFLSVLLGYLFDYRNIVFSNERSSNESNVKYLGKDINHQYSKSFDFEKRFRKYSKKYLLKGIEYFSFLRPLYEIQIAKAFSKYPQYFKSFVSCNKKGVKWCGSCPKCLFTFSILFPFIEEKEMIDIFGKNLFEDESLISLSEELLGLRNFKPFECVGTKKEMELAFYLSLKKYKGRGLPVLLSNFKDKKIKADEKILHLWDKNNFLPKEFAKLLKDSLR